MRSVSRLILLLAVVLATAPPASGAGLQEFTGGIHGHSAYSDGYVGSRPADVFASAAGHGDDFFAISDHSDTLEVPASASEECLVVPPPVGCALADQVHPQDSFRKWPATQEQADAATGAAFTGLRGFEWTSDRFGHINVLLSRNEVNAKADGGYADMDAFYGWLTRPVGLGGGSDGLATFNHPGDKKLSTDDPAYNWNDFAYDPAADAQMVGVEVYNSASDFGSPGAHGSGADGWYAHALDAGWHVGAVGAEDLGHHRGDDWGGPAQAKTVVIAPDRSTDALRAALRARRFYAVRRPGYHLDFTVDGAPMGSRIVRPAGATLTVAGTVGGPGSGFALDLVTSGGRVVATGDGSLDVQHVLADGERWFFLRARQNGEAVAFSSPVWIEPGGTSGRWLAGDLHVHSCYSHDVYCGPSDEPLAYEPGEAAADLADDYGNAELLAQDVGGGLSDAGSQAITFGLDVGSRFAEASARGLDYLAISDHERTESSADGGFGAAGVLGLPAYENSIDGHAQMLGARHPYAKDDVAAMRDALHADGGLLQANHPAYKIADPFTGCDAPDLRHWRYGYDFVPDTIEVDNPTSATDAAEAYLECWLQRGVHMAVTGGSDSHWASLAAVGAGAGAPTTFVFAGVRSERGLLDGIAAGRTTVFKRPPVEGGAPLLLEADADGDGSYEAMIGDTVPAGTPMRVRSESASLGGYVKVRANGSTIALADALLVPGGEVDFTAPAEAGWVRADLLALPESAVGTPACPGRGQAISPCTYDQLVLALTSPIYLSAPAAPAPTATATAVPTAPATAVPTAPATAVPTASATAVPTASATAVPTASATAVPTASATAVPTASATAVPTASAPAAPIATALPVAVAGPEASAFPGVRRPLSLAVRVLRRPTGRLVLVFRSSEVGTADVRIRRVHPGRPRHVVRLAVHLERGRTLARLPARLRPGRYRLRATFVDAGLRRRGAATATFRMSPRR